MSAPEAEYIFHTASADLQASSNAMSSPRGGANLTRFLQSKSSFASGIAPAIPWLAIETFIFSCSVPGPAPPQQ
jgi:hypothetical protein